ncbi:MAG TPA: hypothetical protein VFG33_32725 [Kribbella sp.]|uniref:hypothetical protein n=1 Tax=Kribbella sp. TaxID=1871183 RepID=UPI002D78CF1D|nr:hypothetical protein [Kribbella sp.]HET6298188.1 hypothetical protein [Kribbella sp.]
MSKRPWVVVVGVVVVLLGLLFTLQGTNIISGSAMSGTTTWSVAGPIIIVIGLFVAGAGLRGRRR